MLKPIAERVKAANQAQAPGEELAAFPAAMEKHYSSAEIASAWNVSVASVRRIFQREPGVVSLAVDIRHGRREYRTLRIPESVLARVYGRVINK